MAQVTKKQKLMKKHHFSGLTARDFYLGIFIFVIRNATRFWSKVLSNLTKKCEHLSS